MENGYGNLKCISPVGRFTEHPLLKMRVQSVQWIAQGMTVDWRHQGEARQKRIGELHLFKISSFFLRKAYPQFGRGSH